MSVLICPVCQGKMREVTRQGILIDTCTQCRGVWLDRGELEKLASVVGEPSGPGTFLPQAAAYRNDDDDRRRRDERRHDDDDDDRRRHHYGHGKRPEKSKMSRFLDFFD
jgi:Zn-finger nucleic acid-binding protein